MVWESVLVNGDYAVRVCHADLMGKSRAVTEIQIMRAEHVRLLVKKGKHSIRKRFIQKCCHMLRAHLVA